MKEWIRQNIFPVVSLSIWVVSLCFVWHTSSALCQMLKPPPPATVPVYSTETSFTEEDRQLLKDTYKCSLATYLKMFTRLQDGSDIQVPRGYQVH